MDLRQPRAARRFQHDVGDFVTSGYSAPWVGIVLDRTSRKDANPLYTVRVVLDRNRNPVQKAIRSKPRTIDEAWLSPYQPRSEEEVDILRRWGDPATGWAEMSAVRVASAFMSRDLIREVRTLSSWDKLGPMFVKDVEFDRATVRYEIVPDHRSFWAIARIGSHRWFVEPSGNATLTQDNVSPYDSAREAQEAVVEHVNRALRTYGPPQVEEPRLLDRMKGLFHVQAPAHAG